jgi:hypothetical protein
VACAGRSRRRRSLVGPRAGRCTGRSRRRKSLVWSRAASRPSRLPEPEEEVVGVVTSAADEIAGAAGGGRLVW